MLTRYFVDGDIQISTTHYNYGRKLIALISDSEKWYNSYIELLFDVCHNYFLMSMDIHTITIERFKSDDERDNLLNLNRYSKTEAMGCNPCTAIIPITKEEREIFDRAFVTEINDEKIVVSLISEMSTPGKYAVTVKYDIYNTEPENPDNDLSRFHDEILNKHFNSDNA